jgi:hypothetical protein
VRLTTSPPSVSDGLDNVGASVSQSYGSAWPLTWRVLHFLNVYFNVLKLCILTRCICVPYGSHSKQGLFPQTALTGRPL